MQIFFSVSNKYFCRHTRLKSPSIPRETTRDELIDSIVHTRTREHRPLPGFKSASDYDERRSLRVDCDKVYPGIIIGDIMSLFISIFKTLNGM